MPAPRAPDGSCARDSSTSTTPRGTTPRPLDASRRRRATAGHVHLFDPDSGRRLDERIDGTTSRSELPSVQRAA
ncbi:hypothetical protein FAGKG844_350049 [Frankia sp. AgKG'84/4]